MPARFGEVKFNLMRAIELFQDMNHEDMDVTAPSSSRDFFKEHEVAERLNQCLEQLIEEGVFDDCDLREVLSTDDETSDGELSTPESEGFDYGGRSPDDQASKESFTGRFKRYVRRILPGIRRPSQETEEEEDIEEEASDRSLSGVSGSRRSQSSRASSASSGSRRIGRASLSRSRRSRGSKEDGMSQGSQSGSYRRHSRERSGSEPYDPNVVYAHSHQHKHNHPNPHHHHEHGAPHTHTYHRHVDEPIEDQSEYLPEEDEEDYDSHGLSGTYQAESDDDLSSGPLASSRSSSRRSTSAGRRSLSRGRR